MKKLLLVVFSSLFFLETWAQPIPELKDIESCIESAFNQSFPDQKNQIRPIMEKLSPAHQENASPWLIYWQAYGHYYEGIYLMQMDQKDASEEVLEKGLELLDSKSEWSSEDHVLAGTIMGLMMSVSPGKVMSLSAKSSKHYSKALELAPDNMRVYLALGKSDFYKPKMFGGGKNVEEYLLKALKLDDKYTDDPNAPSWGREEVYGYLVRFYQRVDRLEEARLYLKQGLKLYPQDYMLNELSSGL